MQTEIFAERFSRSLRQFVSYSEVHQMGVQNDVEMHRLGTMAQNRKMLERFEDRNGNEKALAGAQL